MARCGCAAVCSCAITEGSDNVHITGNGSPSSPLVFVVDPTSLEVVDTSTVDLTLTGDGSAADPFVLSAEAIGADLSADFNGVHGEITLEPTAAGDTAYMVKNPGGWGLSGIYGEGQLLLLLSDSERDADFLGGTQGGVITAISNTTPIRLTVAGHGYLTGDTACVKATGIAAIDMKWHKLTKVDANTVSLDGSVAGGAGALSAASVLYGDPNPVMFRVDAFGDMGVQALHVPINLRSFAGAPIPAIGGGGGASIWIQPHADIPGVMVFNTDKVSNPQALVSQYMLAVDVHSATSRTIWQLEVDGTQTMKRESGRADSAELFRIRNDADTADVMYIRADGGVYGQGISAFGKAVPAAGINLTVQAAADANSALGLYTNSATQTGDLLLLGNSAGAVLSRVNKGGYYMTRKVAAPADADLAASELAFWLDATPGATKAMFKAKDSGGTVRTGSVALT